MGFTMSVVPNVPRGYILEAYGEMNWLFLVSHESSVSLSYKTWM